MNYTHSFLYFLVCFFIAVSLFTASAYAQKAELLKTDDEEQKEIPLEEIPEEVIEEAFALQAKCESDAKYNEFLNCECLGAKMMDERLKRGPKADADLIFIDIQKDCKDGTNAAGRQYRSCLGSGSLLPPGVETKPFCECVARTYAKFIETKGTRVPRAMQQMKMQSAARQRCYNQSSR